ncbi:hypothetical protein B0H34DRAFT_669786 [Crassisporium funariophilum]|nr:hypothetical protein B0H34DRAFT_669786 [Crassisporium funariophilum]
MDSEAVSVDLSLLSLPQFREPMIGAEIARVMSIALFALTKLCRTVYEYAITVDDEKKHFWKGPFSVSHGLFFFWTRRPEIDFIQNRYFPACIMIMNIICKTQQLTLTVLPHTRLLNIRLLRNKPIRRLVIIFFHYLKCDGLKQPTTSQLNIMIEDRALITRSFLDADGNLHLDYTSSPHQCGLLETRSTSKTFAKRVNIPAIFSPLVLATTSIATTRIMFSLRSVAVSVGSDFEWLPMPEAEHDTESIAPSKLKMVISAPISSTFRKTKRDEENGLCFPTLM